MLTSTATVATSRASRYRDQLASHGAGMMRHGDRDESHVQAMQEVRTDGESVTLRLASGTCTVTATGDSLVLVAQAETTERLEKIQAGVEQRITKIGRRDGLMVRWGSVVGEAESAAVPADWNRRRSLLTVALVVALVVVMAAVHVGAAAFLLRHHWTWWVLALIAVGAIGVKVVVARHFGMAMRMHLPAGVRGD